MSLWNRPGRAVAYALAAVVAAGAGCGGDGDKADGPEGPAQADQTAAPPRKLTPAQAAELIGKAAGNLTILDARAPEDYAAERVAGAIHLSPKIWPAELERRLATFDRGGRYLLYCRLGEQCARLAESLSALGFKQVLFVTPGGLDDLKALGVTTERTSDEATTTPSPAGAGH